MAPRPDLHEPDELCPLGGRELRYATLLALAGRFGLPRRVPEMLADLADMGIRPGGTPANKVLADALRWEVQRGRVERVAHGRYRLASLPDTTRRRAKAAVRAAIETHRARAVSATSQRIR
jgi:hypothetical protein